MTFLETNRLRLRNVSPKDAIQMVDYRNNERCSKYQRGQTKDYKDIVALIERNKDNALNIASPTMISVALRETDVMIGEIVVMPNEGTISLGYTFSYKVHRNGYAYEALSSLIEYLHKHYPQWDFICFTERENIPSMSLLKKLGYTNLGYLPSKNSQVFGKWLRQDTLDSPGHIRRNHKCGSITPGLSQPQKQGLGHRTPQKESVPRGKKFSRI